MARQHRDQAVAGYRRSWGHRQGGGALKAGAIPGGIVGEYRDRALSRLCSEMSNCMPWQPSRDRALIPERRRSQFGSHPCKIAG